MAWGLVPDFLVGVTNATDVVAVAATATAVSDFLAAFRGVFDVAGDCVVCFVPVLRLFQLRYCA